MLERSPILEMKFATTQDDVGDVIGLAAAFGNVDAVGDIILPGAFAASLTEHKTADTTPAMMWAHNPSEPIGVWQSLRETAQGLEVRGKFSDVPRGRDARTLAKDGAVGLSIGFRVREFDYDTQGHRLLKQIDLVEISVVAVPANKRAKITSVKSGVEITARTLEAILRDAAVPRKMAASVIASGWKGAADIQSESESKAIKSLITEINAATAALTKKGL